MKRILQAAAAKIVILLSVIAGACTPEACFEETNAFVKASFYINENQVTPDSLTLYGLGHESAKLYNKAVKVKPALFPLNSSDITSTFIIRINGISDTITFTYSSYPHLISTECGYTFYHILEQPTFTKNNIDNIIVRNRNITTINEENIRIFY